MLWIVESSSNWMRAVDTSQHVGLESCESKPGTGWGRGAETPASANTGTSRRFQTRQKRPFAMEITWGLVFSWEWRSRNEVAHLTPEQLHQEERQWGDSRRRNGCDGMVWGKWTWVLNLIWVTVSLNWTSHVGRRYIWGLQDYSRKSIEQAVKSSSKNLHAGQQNDERYPSTR